MLNFDQMEKMTLQILPYLPATLELLLLSLLLAIVLGLGAALSRIYRIPVLQRVSQAYILLGRAVPTLIILYVVFYGLPMILLMIRGQADLTLIAEMPSSDLASTPEPTLRKSSTPPSTPSPKDRSKPPRS